MAENLEKRPSKGILKSSSSFEQPDAPAPVKKKHKETKWDEMNIIATLHPADKDYGHMKIEEPKTPYNWVEGEEGTEEADGIDANLLAEKIRLGATEPARVFREEDEEEEDDDDDDEEESPEERAQRKVFESKRKAHYNEYYAVKLARKLMDKDEDDEEDEDGDEAEGKDNNDKNMAEKADSEPSEKCTPKYCKDRPCSPNCKHRHRKSPSSQNDANSDSLPSSSHDHDGCAHV